MTLCFVKKYITSDWEGQYITFDLKATNNTEKKIYGFKFIVEIKDGAGNSLYTSGGGWTPSCNINMKSSEIVKNIVIDYDYSDNLAKLKAADLEKLQIEYHLLSIIYDDGTSFEIEE